MRTLALVVLTVVLAVPAATAATARLTILHASPLTVRGVGFAPRERVRVTATVPETATRWSTASSAGAFVVRFTGTAIPSCTGFSVRAFGASGTRATLRVPQLECPQPPSP